MADYCPVSDPSAPFIPSLLGSSDCHIQVLVHAGYGALFSSGGAFTDVLTIALTLYIAVIGYQLMLGRSQLTVSDFAVVAVKLGAILALATQWPLYEQLVYNFLFHGPEQLAVLLQGRGSASAKPGIIASLQHAFDDLNLFSPAAPPGPNHHDPNAAASLPIFDPQHMSPPASDALLFMVSASILLFSLVGLLLAAKWVLGLLLALGPLFIALFLFESTRGVFIGWVRATLAAALTPALVIATLGLTLTLLEPSLAQIELMNDKNIYIPGVGMTVFILANVMALCGVGLTTAAAVIAGSFRLPSPKSPPRPADPRPRQTATSAPILADRTERIVAALATQDRTRVVGAPSRSDPVRPASPMSSGDNAPTTLPIGQSRRRAVRPGGPGRSRR